MANFTLNRPDVFPTGTVVSAYPIAAPSLGFEGPLPGTATATATVDAAGAAAFTTLAADTPYVFSAQVAGQWRRIRGRVSATPNPGATGTANTTAGSNTVASAAATAGGFQVGQRITGPGIPPGTFITAISGGTLTLSDKATATATGANVEAHGANRWRAQVMQRRAARGTA